MVVVVAAGLAPQVGFDIFQSMETMTAFIAATAKGDVSTGSVAYKSSVRQVGTTLFVITLVMNMISIRFVRRYRQGTMSAHSEAIGKAPASTRADTGWSSG